METLEYSDIMSENKGHMVSCIVSDSFFFCCIDRRFFPTHNSIMYRNALHHRMKILISYLFVFFCIKI